MYNFIAWVYIVTNRTNSVLYTGSTIDNSTRFWEHLTKRNKASFTAKYNVNKLVYVQGFLSVYEARKAEKYIKGKTRAWKRAFEKHNPYWKDLSKTFATKSIH